MQRCTIEESYLPTSQGKLYAQRLTPEHVAHTVPLILLHDSLGSIQLWRDFPHALAQATGRQVVLYDRIGFGRSDVFLGQLPHRFVQDEATHSFHALLNHFAIDQFVVFGHSVGGGMALAIAATYPERCLGVMTEAAQSHLEQYTLEGVRNAKVMFAQPGQLERLAKYHGDKARWVLDAWIETWLNPEFWNWSLDKELQAIRCPVLAIHGELDEFGTVRHVQYIDEQVSAPVTLAILPGLGHVPHKEAPEQVLECVQAFLAKL